MISPLQVTTALKRSCSLLVGRLEALEDRVRADDVAAWPDYLAALTALVTVLPHLAPGAQGEALTTKEMAARLGVAPKTLLKWRKAGKVAGAQQHGARGRAALRWKA